MDDGRCWRARGFSLRGAPRRVARAPRVGW